MNRQETIDKALSILAKDMPVRRQFYSPLPINTSLTKTLPSSSHQLLGEEWDAARKVRCCDGWIYGTWTSQWEYRSQRHGYQTFRLPEGPRFKPTG